MLQNVVKFVLSKPLCTLAMPVRQASNFCLAAARGRSSALQLGVEAIWEAQVVAFQHTTLTKTVSQITSTPSCSAELLPEMQRDKKIRLVGPAPRG